MTGQLEEKALRTPQSIGVTSSAFEHGKAIPREHSGHGEDVSPPLAWTGVPKAAQALALVVDDPDAPRGTWTHWTLWNLPPATSSLARGADVRALGAVEGMTSNGRAGYHGPAPPSGTHRYFFRVFALDAAVDLPMNAPVEDVWRALGRHAIAWGEIMGTFTKA